MFTVQIDIFFTEFTFVVRYIRVNNREGVRYDIRDSRSCTRTGTMMLSTIIRNHFLQIFHTQWLADAIIHTNRVNVKIIIGWLIAGS